MGSPVAAGEAEYTWRGMDRASLSPRMDCMPPERMDARSGDN